MVYRVCLVLLDHGERRVHLDLQEHPVPQELLAAEVRRVLTVLLDRLVCWDHLVLEVHKERRVNVVLLAKLVTLDRLAPLASRPGTMLLPFLLCLDRDPPRVQIL